PLPALPIWASPGAADAKRAVVVLVLPLRGVQRPGFAHRRGVRSPRQPRAETLVVPDVEFLASAQICAAIKDRVRCIGIAGRNSAEVNLPLARRLRAPDNGIGARSGRIRRGGHGL